VSFPATAILKIVERDGRLVTRVGENPYAYWREERISLPPGVAGMTIASTFFANSAELLIKFPDWAGQGYDDGSGLLFGLGVLEKRYLAAFWLGKRDRANRLYVHVGSVTCKIYALDRSVCLPADYTAAEHVYWVRSSDHLIVFGVDSRPCAFVLHNTYWAEGVMYETALPYAIVITPFRLHGGVFVIMELTATKGGRPVGASVELPWNNVRAPGHAHFWNVLPLYVEGSATPMAGYTVGSGSVTSHPVPLWGIWNKSLYFMADQSGTLLVETYSPSAGGWIPFASLSVSANSLVRLGSGEQHLLVRLTFTPSAYPATIKVAEARLW
jgi:hypothetical protein